MALASLPWYDLQALRPATDELWELLRRNLRKRGFRNVPCALERHLPHEVQWRSDDLLFSQACGYDVLFAHRERLKVIATPIYSADGCAGPNYSSFIVVRKDSAAHHVEQLLGSRAVVNSMTSHSGMNALRAVVAPLHRRGRFFSNVRISDSHEGSLAMISQGLADVAAIDCVTYGLLARHCPESVSGVRVLCCSGRMPAPPYVASAKLPDFEIDKIRMALTETLEDPASRSVRRALLLDGIQRLPLESYDSIAEWEEKAAEFGYTEMSVSG